MILHETDLYYDEAWLGKPAEDADPPEAGRSCKVLSKVGYGAFFEGSGLRATGLRSTNRGLNF